MHGRRGPGTPAAALAREPLPRSGGVNKREQGGAGQCPPPKAHRLAVVVDDDKGGEVLVRHRVLGVTLVCGG